MIGKIVQGADFRGVVNYVLQKPDAEPFGSRGLRNDSIDHIVDSFRAQASLNPIAKPVPIFRLISRYRTRSDLRIG